MRPAKNMIKDSMFHLSPKSGASVEYAKASLVAFVGGLMAMGLTFEDALTECIKCFPPDYRTEAIPDSWLTPVLTHILS